MYPAQLIIPGVNGPVTVSYSFWRGFAYSVDGARIRPSGFLTRRILFPGAEGQPAVEATLRGGWVRTHPAIVVGETTYAVAPEAPLGQRLLALSPLLGILLIQGALGFLFAFAGAAIGLHLLRSDRPAVTRITLTLLTLVVVLGLDVALLAAVYSTK